MYYNQKLIVSGPYIELYDYEKALRRDFTRKKITKPDPIQTELDTKITPERNSKPKSASKRKDSVTRTRNEIRRLINSNPDFSKFYTLTFAENITDVKITNKHFSKFIMRMEYRYEKFKYIAIIEFQKRGAVHYHFLCNLPFIDWKEIETIWGFGFIKVKKADTVTNMGAYFCKYLNKDMTDKRLFNKKKYFCSRNLDRQTDVYDKEIIKKLIEQYDLDHLKTEYESTYSGEYTGKVKYRQFKLKNLDI
jgi:hypothetical protein